MHYRVHGIGRKLRTEISATVHAQSREEAQRIAEATMVVSLIDEPEDPLDVPPATVNETPNVGAIEYAAPAAPLRPLPLPTDYQGIIVGSWILRICACVFGTIAVWNFSQIPDRHGDNSFVFTAIFWMGMSAALYVGGLVSLAIREMAINSRIVRFRDHDIPSASDPTNAS